MLIKQIQCKYLFLRVVFNCRYAYETGDDDEEGISLTGAGVIVAGDLATKVDKRDHVFGLAEDLEEDKRE